MTALVSFVSVAHAYSAKFWTEKSCECSGMWSWSQISQAHVCDLVISQMHPQPLEPGYDVGKCTEWADLFPPGAGISVQETLIPWPLYSAFVDSQFLQCRFFRLKALTMIAQQVILTAHWSQALWIQIQHPMLAEVKTVNYITIFGQLSLPPFLLEFQLLFRVEIFQRTVENPAFWEDSVAFLFCFGAGKERTHEHRTQTDHYCPQIDRAKRRFLLSASYKYNCKEKLGIKLWIPVSGCLWHLNWQQVKTNVCVTTVTAQRSV